MSYPQSGSYRSFRASNADRDRAVDSLRAAYAEGRLNDAEFRHRVDEVLRSVTYGELERWTHDIPNGPVPPQLYGQQPAALPPALRGPGYPVRGAPRRDISTLMLGIGGYLGPGPILWIPAIIVARQARRDVRNGELANNGMIAIGLAAAYAGLAVMGLLCALFVLGMIAFMANGGG